jgi:C2 domain
VGVGVTPGYNPSTTPTTPQHSLHSPISDEFHSYITVKLGNVKSTTVPVSGTLPTWEQEFIFELNPTSHEGIIIELWNRWGLPR